MRTFMDAFPNGTVWNTQGGGGGYDVVVLGQIEPTRIDVPSAEQRVKGNPELLESLSEVRLASATDLLAAYGAGAPDLAAWFEDTPVNQDLSLKLEYISGLAPDLLTADEIYASMTRLRSYPTDLFVAPPEVEADLRSRIQR
jgi:spermidine synthase